MPFERLVQVLNPDSWGHVADHWNTNLIHSEMRSDPNTILRYNISFVSAYIQFSTFSMTHRLMAVGFMFSYSWSLAQTITGHYFNNNNNNSWGMMTHRFVAVGLCFITAESWQKPWLDIISIIIIIIRWRMMTHRFVAVGLYFLTVESWRKP